MQPKIALLHTTSFIVGMMIDYFRDTLPNVKIINLVDEGVGDITSRVGKVNEQVVRRICTLATMAEELDVDMCMSTCSATAAAVDTARQITHTPIIKINEPLFEAAVGQAENLGLLVTDPAAVEPSETLIEEVAKRFGKSVKVQTVLDEAALSARMAGDVEKHNHLLLESAKGLASNVEVILLAQASMVGFAPEIQKVIDIPVLTNLTLAADRIMEMLGE